MSYHSSVSLGARHAIHNWEYSDAAARTSATGLDAGDIGKIAKQLDDSTLWALLAADPVWRQIDPAAAGDESTAALVGASGHNQVDLNNFYDGTFLESARVKTSSAVGVIICSVDKAGGGNLTLRISGTTIAWDTTPAKTVELTAGTDGNPVLNFVYVTEAAGVLTLNASTVNWPAAGDFAAIAEVLCQSAASYEVDRGLKIHAYTDHTRGVQQGELAETSAWIRRQHATWVSGLAVGNMAVVDPDAYLSVAAGMIAQKHLHSFPARDMQAGDPIWVVNDPAQSFRRILTLDAITQDAANGPINNKWLSIILWVSVNEDEVDCKMFLNLPTGTYNTQAAAESDQMGYSVFVFPSVFKGTAQLAGRYIVQAKDSGAWVQGSIIDLREDTPSSSPGASGQITEHGNLLGLPDPLAHPQYALLAAVNAWIAAQNPTIEVLAYAATIAINATLSNAYAVTLTAAGILGNPTGPVVRAMSWTVEIIQGGTGGFALTFDSNYVGPASSTGTTPLDTTGDAPGKIRILTFYALSATKIAVTDMSEAV